MKRIVTIIDETGMETYKLPIRKLLTGLLLLIAISTSAGNCTALTKTGAPCKSTATKGTTFCFVHNSSNWCQAKRKDGQPCHAMKLHGSNYCSHHQTISK